MSKIKRSITVIKKNLQFSAVITFATMGGIVTVLMFALTRLFFSVFEKGVITTQSAAVVHAKVFFISLIAVALFAYVFGLWTSHKIAGPIYRLEVAMKRMSRGDLASSRIYLRKGDLIHDTSEVFNHALENFREKIEQMRENNSELDTLLEKIEEQCERPAGIAKARKTIAQFKSMFALSEDEARDMEHSKDDQYPEPGA